MPAPGCGITADGRGTPGGLDRYLWLDSAALAASSSQRDPLLTSSANMSSTVHGLARSAPKVHVSPGRSKLVGEGGMGTSYWDAVCSAATCTFNRSVPSQGDPSSSAIRP